MLCAYVRNSNVAENSEAAACLVNNIEKGNPERKQQVVGASGLHFLNWTEKKKSSGELKVKPRSSIWNILYLSKWSADVILHQDKAQRKPHEA